MNEKRTSLAKEYSTIMQHLLLSQKEAVNRKFKKRKSKDFTFSLAKPLSGKKTESEYS